jgi:hypothetical protein
MGDSGLPKPLLNAQNSALAFNKFFNEFKSNLSEQLYFYLTVTKNYWNPNISPEERQDILTKYFGNNANFDKFKGYRERSGVNDAIAAFVVYFTLQVTTSALANTRKETLLDDAAGLMCDTDDEPLDSLDDNAEKDPPSDPEDEMDLVISESAKHQSKSKDKTIDTNIPDEDGWQPVTSRRSKRKKK